MTASGATTRRGRAAPASSVERWGYWLAVNALNLTDAALSHLAISSGAAVEGNPMVRAVGLPAKVVFVALASAVVAALRPRALIVAIVALGAVVAYELAGLACAGRC